MGISYIGRGDIAISDNPDDVIKTATLGSCVGVLLHDPKLKIAAVGHITLPDSSVRSCNEINKPGRFANTGIPLLVKSMEKMGSAGGKSIIVKIAGGAFIKDKHETFNIGIRNVIAIKRNLSKYGLVLNAEDTGSNIGRVMEAKVDTGEVILSSPGRSKWKL